MEKQKQIDFTKCCQQEFIRKFRQKAFELYGKRGKSVGDVLRAIYDRQGNNGVCFAAQGNIGSIEGYSVSTVKRSIAALKRIFVLDITRRGKQETNLMTICWANVAEWLEEPVDWKQAKKQNVNVETKEVRFANSKSRNVVSMSQHGSGNSSGPVAMAAAEIEGGFKMGFKEDLKQREDEIVDQLLEIGVIHAKPLMRTVLYEKLIPISKVAQVVEYFCENSKYMGWGPGALNRRLQICRSDCDIEQFWPPMAEESKKKIAEQKNERNMKKDREEIRAMHLDIESANQIRERVLELGEKLDSMNAVEIDQLARKHLSPFMMKLFKRSGLTYTVKEELLKHVV